MQKFLLKMCLKVFNKFCCYFKVEVVFSCRSKSCTSTVLYTAFRDLNFYVSLPVCIPPFKKNTKESLKSVQNNANELVFTSNTKIHLSRAFIFWYCDSWPIFVRYIDNFDKRHENRIKIPSSSGAHSCVLVR